MKTRYLFAGLAAIATSIIMAGQQGAPNEGRTLQGPALRIERNVEYERAGGQALTLDLYAQSRAAKPSPVVLWIHGMESGLGSSKSPTPAGALVTPGYAVASIDYRTGAILTDQLADAKAAIRWLRQNAQNYNLDGAHVAAVGYGIGGEIAALLGTAKEVQAVVDLAAPIDKGGVNPIAQATKDSAPTLILHGTADKSVSTWESQRLVSALKVAGANATLELQIGATHDLGQLLSPLAMQTVTSFLDQQLRGTRVPGGTSSYIATPLTEYVDPVALDLGGTLYRMYPTPVRGPNTFASYRVYLPPDYETNTTRRYPVIYFLHGSLVDSKRPITSGYIARVDAAIRSGVMPPTIVVIPQGLNQGRWMDSKDSTAPMESVLIKNLIPYIDANYRTIATRAGRAIEGHSMGGFGALHNGFNNPDVFIAVTGNSPGGATLDTGEDATPAPNRIDSFKVVYGSDRNYYIAMAPTTLAEKNAAKLRQQSIRIITGTEDALFPGAVFVHDALTKLNIPHEFLPVEKSPHNHDQLLQYETFDTMAFYGKVFGKPASGPQSGSVDPEVANASSGLKWPAGYIEPNTPNMKYVPPDTPQGTGPNKAIMATDAGAKEFVLYYPADLKALGAKKMPIVLWGNGSCTYTGNKFRNFLTEIASHGYLAIAGGPMGPPSAETITMASNNWTPSATGPKPEPRRVDPSTPRVTVELLSQGITWAIAENSRQGSKFYGKLDTNAVAVMGQSCGAGLAASFGKDKRVKTIGVWSGSNKTERDNIAVPALYISGSEIYDVAYPGSMDDFKAINTPIFHGWRTGMTHLGTYRQYLGGELAPIATAWLDWQLKGDQTAATWFKGADCKLCKDTNWHVDKKKIEK